MATIRSYTVRVAPGSALPLSIGETVNIGSVTLYFKGRVGAGYVMEMTPAGLKPTAKTTISPEDATRGMNSPAFKPYLIFEPVDQVVESASQRATSGPPSVDTLIALGYPTASAVVIAKLEAEAAEARVYPHGPEPRSPLPAELRYPRLVTAFKAAMAGALDDAIALILEEKAARVPRVVEVQPEPISEAPAETVEKDDPSLPLSERVRIALADKDRTSHNRIKEIAEKIKSPGKKNIRADLVTGILTTIANTGDLTEQVWALIQQPAE